jgi:hypothetical protein
MYRSAQLLHLGWKKYLIVVIPVFVFANMLFIPSNQNLPNTAILFVVCLLAIPFLAWRVDSSWKKVYESTPYFQYPYSGELTEAGYAATNQIGTSSLPWSDITGYKVENELLIFYQGPMCFHILARSFFSNMQQWEAAKALISSRINGLS